MPAGILASGRLRTSTPGGRSFSSAPGSGAGFAPFGEAAACRHLLDAWTRLDADTGWRVTHAVVMPNHVHFILNPARAQPLALREVVRAFKGRTARQLNQALGRTGAFWQADWFDRWLRTAEEEAKVEAYIRENPVKAGLVADCRAWPWRIDESALTPAPR